MQQNFIEVILYALITNAQKNATFDKVICQSKWKNNVINEGIKKGI